MRQEFHITYINSVQGVLDNIQFIAEGWQALSRADGARLCIPIEAYMQVLFRVVAGRKDCGSIILYKSKNDKPLGYIVVFEDTETGGPRSCIIYAGYSNGKYLGAAEESMPIVETWARKNGFKELHAQSRRMAGAAMRLFKRKLGFKPACIVFKKEL